MVDKNKILYLHSFFTKAEPLPAENETLQIAGYASTTDVDRHGDVIPASVWQKGLENYLKNPVILAFHDHTQPVGRMVEHKIDEKGLWIKAKISKAAEKVHQLVKDEVLTAFSVGFRIKDAEYNSSAEVFLVKDLELHEISVVSVPANQNTLFSLSKSFGNESEYREFIMQFAPPSESAKGLELLEQAKSNLIEELNMDSKELKELLAQAAQEAAVGAAKAIHEQQAREAAEKAERERQERELQDRIAKAIAAVTPTETGAEKLLAEVEKRFQEQADSTKSVIAGLEEALKEKAQELEAIQRSKMQFADKGQADAVSYTEKENAVLLSKVMGRKSVADTKYGAAIIQKAGAHQPTNANVNYWETEVSLAMEAEVRRRLVMAPLMRGIAMQTNVMKIPVNPEAGLATWVQNSEFGTSASAGAAQTHQLSEITLSAYKVATREYLAYEEEEDSLLVLLPVIRDAMVRRVARAVDKAMINGAGAGADPVKGVAMYDATSAVTVDSSAAVTVANLRALRKDLGAWGLDPAELVYVVNTEVYYNLLDDSTFQTVDKVGPQATLLTGQIGSIANTPVVVSGEFPSIAEGAATAASNIAAFCFAPANFLVGNQRGLRVDTDDLVETQRRVLVASLRTGLTQLTTNLGGAVSTLRYVNAA
jgi:HK97 family phage prohead protease/HK97 family phage major capsid protein